MVALKLLEDFTMQTANLGDSGYALFHVLPDDTLQMYYRQESQQKTHNFPYQCGTMADDARESEVFWHKDLQDGDVVLVFSDGFQDNVFDSGFPYCIEEYLENG